MRWLSNYATIDTGGMNVNEWNRDIDIANTTTMNGNEVGVIILVLNTSNGLRDFGLQSASSNDNRVDNTAQTRQTEHYVKLGGTTGREIDLYADDLSGTQVRFYVVGFLESEAEMLDNLIDISPASAGVWDRDVDATGGHAYDNTATAVLLKHVGNSTRTEIGWEHPDETDNIQLQNRQTHSGLCGVNGSEQVALYLESLSGQTIYTNGILHKNFVRLSDRITVTGSNDDVVTELINANAIGAIVRLCPNSNNSRGRIAKLDTDFPEVGNDPKWPDHFYFEANIREFLSACNASGELQIRLWVNSNFDSHCVYGYITADGPPPVTDVAPKAWHHFHRRRAA